MKKSNEPWNETDVWKNQSEFFTWLRGQIRKSIWQFYPVKNEFKNDQTFEVTNEEKQQYGLSKSTKKAGKCVFCNHYFPKSKLEVDHIEQVGSLKSFDDVSEFVSLLACSKDNMQLTCKPCHKIKSYAERHDVSFDEAKAIKGAIEIIKNKEDKAFLAYRGISPGSNQKQRREQIITYLKSHPNDI